MTKTTNIIFNSKRLVTAILFILAITYAYVSATSAGAVYVLTEDPETGRRVADYSRDVSGRYYDDDELFKYLFSKGGDTGVRYLEQTNRAREINGLEPLTPPEGSPLYNYMNGIGVTKPSTPSTKPSTSSTPSTNQYGVTVTYEDLNQLDVTSNLNGTNVGGAIYQNAKAKGTNVTVQKMTDLLSINGGIADGSYHNTDLGAGDKVNAEGQTYWYFEDVPDGHPYAQAINRAASLLLIPNDTGKFNPDEVLTWDVMYEMLAKMRYGLNVDLSKTPRVVLDTNATTDFIDAPGVKILSKTPEEYLSYTTAKATEYWDNDAWLSYQVVERMAAVNGGERWDSNGARVQGIAYKRPVAHKWAARVILSDIIDGTIIDRGRKAASNNVTDAAWDEYGFGILETSDKPDEAVTKGKFLHMMYRSGCFTDPAVNYAKAASKLTDVSSPYNRNVIFDATTIENGAIIEFTPNSYNADRNGVSVASWYGQFLTNREKACLNDDILRKWGFDDTSRYDYCPELLGGTVDLDRARTRAVELYNADTARVLALMERRKASLADLAARVAAQDGADQPLVDAPKTSDWAREQVSQAQALGLVPEGYLGSDYTKNITRAQFAAVSVKLYEAMSGNKAPVATANPFKDTTDPVVLQAYELGIVAGMSADTFEPDALVTREQAAAMLSRAYTKLGGVIPNVKSTSFSDNADISDWAMSSVAFMSQNGIVSGMGDGTFAPKGNATIEQALSISLRMYNRIGAAIHAAQGQAHLCILHNRPRKPLLLLTFLLTFTSGLLSSETLVLQGVDV